jgi:hypothetical protein
MFNLIYLYYYRINKLKLIYFPMSQFNCINLAGKTLANWEIGVDGSEFELSTRCESLKLQDKFAGNLPNNGRNTGDAPILSGNWVEILEKVTPAFEAALENNSIVENTRFYDRYAHQVIRTSAAERLDSIISGSSQLPADDKSKFLERALRDITATVRALEGDVFLLQKLLGAAIIRIDNLEAWSVAEEGALVTNQSDNYNDPQDPPIVPFPDMQEARGYWNFGIDPPIVPESYHNSLKPHRHGATQVTNANSDYKYHQGYYSKHHLKRFWNAARAAGVPEPPLIDPQSHESFSQKRYNQGEI